MNARIKVGRTSFAAVLLALLSLGAAPQVDPGPPVDEAPPRRETNDAGLKNRRDALQKLEDEVQVLRDRVKVELSDVVVGQQIAIDKARKAYQESKTARERAEYAVKEYADGIYLAERATSMGTIFLANGDLELAIDRMKDLEAKANRGIVNPIEVTRARLDQQLAEFQVDEAKTKLYILERYTKDAETKKREAAVAAARAIETEKKGILELELAREANFREQTQRLHVRSPEDLVITLIDDAVQNESKVVALIGEAQKIEAQIREKPDAAASLTEKLTAKKAEILDSMNRARTQLLEAANLGEQVKALRARLRAAEARLKKERELVDILEREFTHKR